MTGEHQLYISYISSIYHKFLIKLVSCPLCLGFWVNICIALYLNDLFAFFGLYCSSVMIYGIFKKHNISKMAYKYYIVGIYGMYIFIWVWLFYK